MSSPLVSRESFAIGCATQFACCTREPLAGCFTQSVLLSTVFATEMEGLLPTLKSDTVSVTDLWEYRIAEKNRGRGFCGDVDFYLGSIPGEPVKYLAGAEAAEGVQPYPHKPRLLVYYASAGERSLGILPKATGPFSLT